LGEYLDNSGFIPCGTKWYSTLDEVMVEHQIPLSITKLISRCPVPIPEVDDRPCIGHWTSEDFAAVDRLAAPLPEIRDHEVKRAIQTAIGWIRSAADHPGSLIVGFHG
jgi:hypothetical protein